MGLARYLKLGRIKINSIDRCIVIGDSDVIIPYDKISPSDWGQVYEKYVGQTLEDEGYEVSYHGLERGFLDRGIDLIVTKESGISFIQCKFTRQLISKSRIEWILYKASNILYERYRHFGKKISFVLIVNSKKDNFSTIKPKGFHLAFTPVSSVEFPMLQYFLDHNYIQDKVRLECREIRMTI
jgi:hypothetical protein